MTDRRLFEEIADEIKNLIRDGTFPPGARLPGERELSERFEVSRVTIREAEIALQATGWIHMRTGAGAYVETSPPLRGNGSLPPVTPFELTEARSLFEAEAAALAAPTITEDTIAKLTTLLEAMADDTATEEEISAIDRDFHMTIAGASNNAAIIHTIETLPVRAPPPGWHRRRIRHCGARQTCERRPGPAWRWRARRARSSTRYDRWRRHGSRRACP
ncbi:GntR family transcriptional regulator [Leptolyngbya sp. 15MV]|nr:GntR family transcriptional regulator [Leptolyngbya sp. 15MV]